MTFCIAFAGPRFAFLAGDTRGWIPDGSGPPTVVDNVRKLSPLSGGWAVTGNRVDVSAIVVRAIADCPAADTAAIATRLAGIRPALLQMIYNQPARDVVAILSQPTAVWIVAADPSAGFTCQQVDWLTGEVAAHGGVCVMPLGADPVETTLLVDRELATISRETTRAGYLAAMRRMAGLFHTVADRLGPSGAVSDVVEVGALWRDDAGQVITEHLPPTATENVRLASDDELEALLARPVVMQVGMLKAIAAVAGGLAQLMVGKAADQIGEAIAHPALPRECIWQRPPSTSGPRQSLARCLVH